MTRGDRLLLIASATPVFTIAGIAALWWLERLTDPVAIVIALALVAALDAALAFVVEHRAPTHIILRHGHYGAMQAEVVGGFDGADPGHGTVRSGHEIWRARRVDRGGRLEHGARVRVVGREELILLVEAE